MCSLCALTALSTDTGVVLNGYLYLGLFIFLSGFILEIIADTQKSKFRSIPKTKTCLLILDYGLFLDTPTIWVK